MFDRDPSVSLVSGRFLLGDWIFKSVSVIAVSEEQKENSVLFTSVDSPRTSYIGSESFFEVCLIVWFLDVFI